jgi:predicted dehydrogenase
MNIGILGAGHIAGTMAETIRMMAGNGEDVSLYAIGSRSERKAESFAMKNGCIVPTEAMRTSSVTQMSTWST